MKPLETGANIKITVNQGEREAWVLAVLGDEALIEYDMPEGTSALRVVKADNPDWLVRRFGYTATPTKWLRAMLDQGSEWMGRPQQSAMNAPAVRSLWRERTGKEYEDAP